jgi:flagellar biosynthesis protein FliP
MNIRKATFTLYILVFILLMVYGIYYEFYDLRFGNYLEKEIVVTKMDIRGVKGGGINYTIVDRENKTYFFSTTEASKILNDYDVRFGESSVFIKYNVRNNEIKEVSNGNETERKKYISWSFIIIMLIILSPVILVVVVVYLRRIIKKKLLKENISDIL